MKKVRIVNHCYAFFFHCIRFNQTKSPQDQVAMDEIEDRLRRKVRISLFFIFVYIHSLNLQCTVFFEWSAIYMY